MSIPLISSHDKEKTFFKKLKENDVFEYSMRNYTYRVIEAAAHQHGVIIEYCKPGTSDYKHYGLFVCRVIGFVDGKGPKSVPLPRFDPEELIL